MGKANALEPEGMRGMGLKTADRIAANAGRPRDGAERLAAGLQYTLETFAEQGHTYMPRGLLVEAAASLLELPNPAVAGAVEQLTAAGERLVAETTPDGDDPAIYTASLHHLETETAQRLLRLPRHPVSAL